MPIKYNDFLSYIVSSCVNGNSGKPIYPRPEDEPDPDEKLTAEQWQKQQAIDDALFDEEQERSGRFWNEDYRDHSIQEDADGGGDDE